MSIFVDYLKLIGWGTVGILTMAISLWVLLSIFTWLTPVDEWDEIKKGNLAVAIVMASVIVGFALVISSAIAPPPIAPYLSDTNQSFSRRLIEKGISRQIDNLPSRSRRLAFSAVCLVSTFFFLFDNWVMSIQH